MIAFRSCLISSIHVRCGLPLGRLTFLRYSASASLAGVSGCSLMRWPSQLRRRLCIVVLHSSVLVLVYSSMLVIFLGQCMPRIFRAHVGFTHNITRVRTLPAMKLPTKKRSVGKRQRCQKQVSLVVADRSITLTVKIGKNTEVVVEKLAV